MARFITPRDIYYGRGALAQLRRLEGRRTVLVGGVMGKENGFLQRAE
ncbi:MAG: butanol dehydrogenase, partial [Clostridia bacterium]|nr:butanol dehydrogenase [Clostridia bacterium]